MTDYGRDTGPESWQPDGPPHGNHGWEDGHPTHGGHPAQQGGWDPYDDPQQAQQPPYGGWDSAQGGARPYGVGVPDGRYDPYANGPVPADPYGTGQFPADPYATGQLPADPYSHGRTPADPYGNGRMAAHPYSSGQVPADPYGNGRQQPDYYGGHGAHPQSGHGQMRQPPPPGQPPQGPAPDAETGWDPGPDQGEIAFFADAHDEPRGDGSPRRGRSGRAGRGGPLKRRRGCACLVLTLALAGGVGAVGYGAYQFYESRFGEAPDYEGEGRGEVQVEIPEGSTLSDMGNILKREGVVKSHDAFVEAAGENDRAGTIQGGIYVLRKEMSAAAAIELMNDPASLNTLILREGIRAPQVYEAIDKKLELDPGTTEEAAQQNADELGLPEWADDNLEIKDLLEGFLYPSRYSVGDRTKPEDLLKQMVERATVEYRKDNIEDEAKKIGVSPYEIVTLASLIQAEAQEDDEFGKVSRVIHNRLDQDMTLGFDSTINYAMGRSTLDTSIADTRHPSPYNTYLHKGLPPGPIGNPGHQAIEAALHPTEGNWLYFVTVKPGDTRFTDNYDAHQKNVEDFNEVQREQANDE